MLREPDLGAFNISDLRALARKRLPRGLFEFVDRGTEDEVALANNRAALDRIRLWPRVLLDVSRRQSGTTLFGRELPVPIIIAPTGMADLMWFHGELALARAAARAGIPFTLATSSTTPFEEVATALNAPFWFQMYMWDDREQSHAVMNRARAAGADTLLLTVDTAVFANREFNQRNGFTNPLLNRRFAWDIARHPQWSLGVMGRYLLEGGMPRYVNYPEGLRNDITRAPARLAASASVTWDDVARLRERWPGRLLLKGVLAPADAVLAVEHGVDGVVVSNHGGRNLDAAVAPIDVLAEIVGAVAGRIAVLYDSGIRRGTDIAKALALGADAVLIGRATLFGLAAAGEQGAQRAIAILRDELNRTLALVGARSISELTPALIRRT
jgi:isopentenyl diphosphate isomerase/L-lactate dehydrogenase-like FMN-dependent dehydrogenase